MGNRMTQHPFDPMRARVLTCNQETGKITVFHERQIEAVAVYAMQQKAQIFAYFI